MDYLLKRGELGVVDIEPSLPLIKYISLYRGDRLKNINPVVSEVAKNTCTFEKLLLAPL
ncbi:hypothetical protein D3C86_1811130 [compost metagenome]